MVKAIKTLSLNIETLRELTPEDAAQVNGGRRHRQHGGHGKVSSVMPVAQPTATAVSSALYNGPQTGARP